MRVVILWQRSLNPSLKHESKAFPEENFRRSKPVFAVSLPEKKQKNGGLCEIFHKFTCQTVRNRFLYSFHEINLPVVDPGCPFEWKPSHVGIGFSNEYFMITDFPLAAVDRFAQPFHESAGWLTNSNFVAAVVTVGLVTFVTIATRKMQTVPTGSQNFLEAIVEMLYDMVEGIVGKHMAPKAFPLLATFFIFIVCANWFALVPGIGTIGFVNSPDQITGPLWSADYINTPLLRPATADVNMTLAMAAFFMVMWLWWSVRENGIGGFLLHIFGPKGGLKGFLAIALMPVFFMVGLIEIVSIAFRPASLSLRLYGNVFAGESLLHAMADLGKEFPGVFRFIMEVLIPLPFYGLEILIGLLQALVFTLLCAVYLQLSTSHDEEEAH